MCVFYGIMLALGLILRIMPQPFVEVLLSNGLVHDPMSALNILSMLGLLLISLLPTAGFYLASHSPAELPRGARNAITVATVFAMLGNLVNYVIAMERVDFNIGGSEIIIFFQMTLLFSYICTIINKFILGSAPAERDTSATEENGIINKAFGVAARIIKAIMNFKDRHNNAYLIISTIFTTLLAIVTLGLILLAVSLVMGICMFVIVGSIVISMIMSSGSSDSGSSSGSSYTSSEEKVYEVNEDGWTRTLTFHSREYSIGGERYRDDRGDYWLTEDGGKTFYREK